MVEVAVLKACLAERRQLVIQLAAFRGKERLKARQYLLSGRSVGAAKAVKEKRIDAEQVEPLAGGKAVPIDPFERGQDSVLELRIDGRLIVLFVCIRDA